MYAILSDLHFHKWSAFSHITAAGLNSRLQWIVDEVWRANEVLQEAGGKTMVLAGDIFHVRGKISPEVLNPVLEVFKRVVESGTRVVGISGNHDLESNDANDLSSAATALRSVGVEITNEPLIINSIPGMGRLALIPYVDNLDKLREAIEGIAKYEYAAETDLIIHAPVDGVIPGLPDHGLTPEYLAERGFKRVFSGHYHNHKEFEGGVYSIGATTHQTWSDIGTKAGFLLVDEDNVRWMSTNAPKFIELDPETEQDEVPLIVDGHFVRVTMEIELDSQALEMRQFLIDSGAKGVLINRIKKKSTVSRTGATVKSGASIETSVGEFITLKKYTNQSALTKLCGEILSEAEVAE